MQSIVVCLGTNLGKREKNLAKAKEFLTEQGICIIRESEIFETEPFGYPDQDFFLNQVLIVETNLSPELLFKTCLDIENKMGRIRAGKFGPRVIDIDLLFYKDRVINTKPLILPHPGIAKRKFVLVPLTELIPEEKHPLSAKTMRQMLDECTDGLIVEAYPR